MSLRHSIPKSFSYALQGLKKALTEEPNFRVHVVLGTLACIFAAVLGFSALEWLILTVTIFFVLVLELINTSMENLVDLVSPEIQNEAKVAKDVSASAVFLSALFSILVGSALFLPKLIALLKK
jgi:diacylglycerol kinase